MGLLFSWDDVTESMIKPIFDFESINDDDEYYRLGYYNCQLKQQIGPYEIGTKIYFITVNFATATITFYKNNSDDLGDEEREEFYSTKLKLSF